MKRADAAANRLLERARDQDDTDAAALLKHLGHVHDVAMDVVRAKTHQASAAAFAQLVDLFNGRKE